jgi:hypothetical protein
LWLWFEKNSFIKSTFYEADLKKKWCLIKIVVEIVVLKKSSFLCLVKKLWLKLWWKKSSFVFGKIVVKKIVSYVWL